MFKVRDKQFGGVLYKDGKNPYTPLIAKPLPRNIIGWGAGNNILVELIDQFKPHRVLEVGTFFGLSASQMTEAALKHTTDFELVCVDTFLGSQEHWLMEATSQEGVINVDVVLGRLLIYEQFLSNMIHAGLTDYVTPMPIDSTNAFFVLQKYGYFADMIYVDGAHDYISASVDFSHYAQLVAPGGVLVGDDFVHPDIKKAVEAVFPNGVEEYGNKFVWRKPQTVDLQLEEL